MSTTTPTFGAALLGQTEKTLNVILDRQLVGTGLDEHQWITLTLAVTAGGMVDREQLAIRVAGGVKVTEAQAHARIAELIAANLLEAPDADESALKVTETGQELHRCIRTAVGDITKRLWGDLPADDLNTAGRVLSTVLERANAELAVA
jgi:DNA-binding MarR family transcriptional regulator